MNRNFRPPFYLLVLAYVGLIGAWRLWLGWPAPPRAWLAALCAAVELLAALYVVSTILKSLAYLLGPRHAPAGEDAAGPAGSRVGVLYLCCDDLDPAAFESLCRLEWPGPLEIVLHDDGRGDARRLAAQVRGLAARHGRALTVLRRPVRVGGKPGAVNYVLEQVGPRFDFLLLCDNDSTALDPKALLKGIRHMSDPRVAAVQFRGRGVADPDDSPIRRRLARAVDVFDVFAWHQSRHGLMPFLGHNGLVRVRALLDSGGLTPGFLSDDIDVSLRWYLAGWRVAYARDVEFGERAPASYAAFRLRARKWAFGCAQVLRRHALAALICPRLTWAHRLGFLEFVGFYAVQVLLLAYLAAAHILVPLSFLPAGAAGGPEPATAVAAAAVLAAILLPTLAFCLKEGRLAEWPALTWTCCLVYGSTAFDSSAAMLAGLARGTREWVPTNGHVRDHRLPARCWAEFAFGAALLAVPMTVMPGLLLLPVSHLFAATYLCSPLVLAFYRPAEPPPEERRRPRAGALPPALAGVLIALAIILTGSSPAAAVEVEVRGREVLVDGRPFVLRGIHYSPWTPGTGPGKGHPWPDAGVVGRDLDMIEAVHAGAILVYDDAPDDLYGLAEARGLLVIQAFHLDWQSIHEDEYVESRREEIAGRVRRLRGRPNLLAWMLGHEVTEWVLDLRGADLIAGRLRALAEAVRRADPAHPITHASWPITKDLDLPFLDIVSFNVYPLWPREVVVRGYGEYLRDVMVPRAGGRPLWITEFGLNTLESTPEQQAATLARCWEAIRAHAGGGVVFSFADEWWKNYDNPIERGNYWERRHAPDDERSHDLDPEEYYGIVDDQRMPKPAYEAVARMYGGRRIPAGVYVGAALAALTGYTIWIFTRHS